LFFDEILVGVRGEEKLAVFDSLVVCEDQEGKKESEFFRDDV